VSHCVSISKILNAPSASAARKGRLAISFVRGATYFVPDLLVRWILWGLLGGPTLLHVEATEGKVAVAAMREPK